MLIDIEYLLPILDLYSSFVIRGVSGLHKIDLPAYAEQSAIYLNGTKDYAKLVGDTGPIQYPAASLYIYSFFNILTGFNITKEFMSDVHIILDLLRMWLLVKIYKTAYGKDQSKIYVFLLLLLNAKYKFVGITRQFNDCFMMLIALAAIYMWQ